MHQYSGTFACVLSDRGYALSETDDALVPGVLLMLAEVYPLRVLYYIGDFSHIWGIPSHVRGFRGYGEIPPKQWRLTRRRSCRMRGASPWKKPQGDADSRRWEQ